MTIPILKISVLRKPVIKGKMDARFPADVSVTSPIMLDRTGGNYLFGLSITDLRASLDVVYAPIGSGALPGGASGQVQYNNGGVFGGLTATLNGVLVTNGAGSPSISTTLPNGIAMGTPASITLTNATGLPVSTGITGLGSGIATFLATPSSANLRGCLTDEVGTGTAYFVGGALGTPASATLTNATGLPLSGLNTQAAFTFVGNNTSGSAVPTAVDIAALTAKASPASTDLVMISDQAASGAWKKVTVSALSSAGSVASYNGRTGTVTATGTDVPVRSYLAGLTLSTAGSSTTFGIAAGVATDSTNVSMMALASAYTKTTSAWALGTAVGSLDTGTIAANTWYHVHLIQRPDTGVVDVLISLSATAPTLPTNYTLFRRIGAMKTNGSSQWVKFVQFGDEFLWDTPVSDVSTSTLGITATLFTLSVPTSVKVGALCRGFMSSATAFTAVLVNSPDEASTAINTPAGNLTAQTQAASTNAVFALNLRTNTSAQIRAVAGAASTSLTIATYGWVDRRGMDL